MAANATLGGWTAQSFFIKGAGHARIARIATSGIVCLLFADDSVETAYFVCPMPSEWAGSTDLDLYLLCGLPSAGFVSGSTCDWEISIAKMASETDDVETLTFDTVTSSTATLPTTTKQLTDKKIDIASADTDAIAAGNWYCLKVERNSASDSNHGDVQLIGLVMQESA